MCLIIDANVASDVFSGKPSVDFQPIWNALAKKKAIAVHGGKLSNEYSKLKRITRLLVELTRQGCLRKIPDEQVKAETIIYKNKEIKSDDAHILALAKVANVRLLCSKDKKLHADFTNNALLNPPGSVYQKHTHSHLISKHCGTTKRHR